MAGTIAASPILERLGIEPENSGACGREWIASSAAATVASLNPASGSELARVRLASAQDCETVITQSA